MSPERHVASMMDVIYGRDAQTELSSAQVAVFICWLATLVAAAWQYLAQPARADAEDHKDDDLPLSSADSSKLPDEGAKAGKPPSSASDDPPASSVITAAAVFGGIMLVYWLLDGYQAFPGQAKVYDRDFFAFLLLVILIWAVPTMKVGTKDALLSRDQTEEWKGWMQIVFLLYHYFAAKELYNFIRVLIASYVWMTGFGNFRYFQLRKDYSWWRLCKMLFRLNFLVVVVCLTMNTEYMLYYICPMHTVWFLSVYAMMAIKPDWNTSNKTLAIKFAVYFVVVVVVWEIPGACEKIWAPLGFLMKRDGSMHEWVFRSGLDHWSTFVGMLCAWVYPVAEKAMQYMDKQATAIEARTADVLKVLLLGVLAWALSIWVKHVYLRDKYGYNAIHTYWSWLPICSYIIARNLWPWLRTRHLQLFERCGKITLETYLCQGNYVAGVICFIPGYPLLNFALSTVIYLYISQKLFDLTNLFSAYLMPKDMRVLGRRCCGVVGTFLGVLVVVVVFRHVF